MNDRKVGHVGWLYPPLMVSYTPYDQSLPPDHKLGEFDLFNLMALHILRLGAIMNDDMTICTCLIFMTVKFMIKNAN